MSKTYKTPGQDARDSGAMFDTKIAVLLRDDLAGWQALNVAAFLVSGLPQELKGEPYVDADDVTYLPMFGQPVVVLQGDKDLLTKAHERALSRNQQMAVFTADLFATGNDEDNRAAVRKVHTQDLDLVGIAVHGQKNAVDKIFKGARMHP
ncbi:DUF2000 domain-containing protein [Lentzea aerocolonigenes]|nr:DUF2000 domain-containing protein [Lentzea aerocolonigenes]